MWTTTGGSPFIVIGEDIHASRVVLRGGKYVLTGADGCDGIRFVDADGHPRILPIPTVARERLEPGGGRVKLVATAILAAMSDGASADMGLAFLRSLAHRQEAAGADYLDLNVDEVSADHAERVAAMRWLVSSLEASTDSPLALDSSSAEVIAAGIDASRRDHGRLLLNSASAERLDVLDQAAATGCSVVVSAAGRNGVPGDADERVENGRTIVEAALARGIPLDRLHLDGLVLPVAVEPDAGAAYLEAIRTLRAAYGPDLHLTGGVSNVSFGLPGRRLLNEVFLGLSVDAGTDSGILDPLVTDPARAFHGDCETRPWQLAVALLTGADAFGIEYIGAYRAGELDGPL
jgi:Pterin binding enzyme